MIGIRAGIAQRLVSGRFGSGLVVGFFWAPAPLSLLLSGASGCVKGAGGLGDNVQDDFAI